jgi:hypothetical protein
MLRPLRRAAAFSVGLLEKVMRDDEMSPDAGKGIHVTKSGSLYVDIDEIRNSPGAKEAARRGDSVLSAAYRPLHYRAETPNKSWTLRCANSTKHKSALTIELPTELAEFLSVQEGDDLIVTSKGSNAVNLRKPSESHS